MRLLTPLCVQEALLGNTKPELAGNLASVNISNTFAALAVDQSPIDPLGQQAVEPLEDFPRPFDIQTVESTTGLGYEADQIDDIAKVKFVLFCLFEDVNRFRTFLQGSWEKYKAGEIDLATAVVAPNTALDMVRP